MSLGTIRHEAAGLSDALPAVLLDAQRLAALAAGAHGRRRAGAGEAFWQFRDHRPEDGARLVDWRRSARGDRLFVREREREAAQTALFWVDPAPGFHFASAAGLPTKARRALTISLALAMLVSRGGERVGALDGGPGSTGAHAVSRLAFALSGAKAQVAPADPGPRAAAIYAGDFYGPLEIWRDRLTRAARAGAFGALLMVSDPAEEDFPYSGRTQFQLPGGGQATTLGRAESAKAEYARRLAAHREALRALALAHGFALVAHRTDHAAAPALVALSTAVAERR